MNKKEHLECRGCIYIKKYPKKCGACSTWLGREVHKLENVINKHLGKALELHNCSHYEKLNEEQVMNFLHSFIEEALGCL